MKLSHKNGKKEYSFVTMIDGVPYYRNNTDPTDEVFLDKGKEKKVKNKIKKLKTK